MIKFIPIYRPSSKLKWWFWTEKTQLCTWIIILFLILDSIFSNCGFSYELFSTIRLNSVYGRTVGYYLKKQSFRYVDTAIVDTDPSSRSIGRHRTTERSGDRWECEHLPLMRYNCNSVMTIACTAPSRQVAPELGSWPVDTLDTPRLHSVAPRCAAGRSHHH